MSSLIELHDLVKSYVMGENMLIAMNHIDLSIQEKEMVAIIGESGSGKSTMMHIVGLLDKPDSGSYLLNGREVATLTDNELASTRNKKMGFVFQAFFLLPRFNTLQNVMLPLIYRGFTTHEAQDRAMKMLEKLDIKRFAHHKPNQMSGGQQQRVAIARALSGNPDIILADEPTGALDSKTSQEVLNLFSQLHEGDQKTVVMITHDPKIAAQCKRIVTIKDGKIIDDKPNIPQKLEAVEADEAVKQVEENAAHKTELPKDQTTPEKPENKVNNQPTQKDNPNANGHAD